MTLLAQETDTEIWLNYNDYYQVSNHGNIRSIERIINKRDGKSYRLKSKVIKQVNNGTGYKQVSLGRKIKSITVHRLVGLVFLPNTEKKKTINHKDGNKHNNHVNNLEWSTYAENNIHARVTGLNKQQGCTNPSKGTDHWNSRLDETQVKTIRLCKRDGMSNADLSRYFKVCPPVIHNIHNRKSWVHVQ